MNRIIIDITELTRWKGRLTGVPRTINELANNFKNSRSVIFCEWSDNDQNLRVVSHLPNISIDQEIEADIEKNYIKKRIKDFIRKYKLTSKVTEIIGTLKGFKKRVGKNQFGQEVNIEAGDTLIVMADWHSSDSNFIKYIKAQTLKKITLVQFAYDLLPIVAPQYSGHATHYLGQYINNIYPLCDLIITISESTKSDIITHLKQLKVNIPTIKTIRLGDNFHFAEPIKPNSNEFLKSDIKSGDYILCVGTIEARKNHELLYYTYKLAKSRGLDLPKCLIVGRPGWHSENILDLILNDPETKEDLLVLKNISDNELSWLYENCIFTIYPSFYEGWGLPVAESIAHGATCLCSLTSSMPEIAGDIIPYFNPFSSDECLNAIVNLLKPNNLKKARESLKRYKPTSWNDTFKQVTALINETK